MEKKKKIFLSADNNFFKHLFVTIASIIDNCSDNKKIEILVFDGGIFSKNKEKLKNYCQKFKTKISFLQVDKKKYNSLKTLDHISEATFYRLEIPKITPKEKVVYLDCDLIVLGDILQMFDLNLEDKTIGGVSDYLLKAKNKKDFNAGVLIIDCANWNKRKYSPKIIKYLLEKGTKLKLGDQEVINEVLVKDKKEIPLVWNRQRSIYDLTHKEIGINKKEYINLIRNPKIVHYAGKIKPWDYRYCFPDKKYYDYYLKKIGASQNYKNKNLKGFLYKFLRRIIYKFKLMRFIKRKSDCID